MDCNIKRVLKRFCLWKLTVLDSCFLPNAEKKHCKEGQKSITLSSLKRFVSYHQITILEWFSHGMSSAWFPWPQNVRHQNQKWNHFVNSPKNNSPPPHPLSPWTQRASLCYCHPHTRSPAWRPQNHKLSHRPRVEAMPPPEFPDPPPHDKEWFHGDPVDIGMQLGVRYPPSIKANIFLNLSTKKQSIAWYGSSFLSHALEL